MKQTATMYTKQDPSIPSSRIPVPIRIMLVQIIRSAYDMVDLLVEQNPFFVEYIHRAPAIGSLRYWAANNLIKRAVSMGTLPGRAISRVTTNNSAEYLEYIFDRVGITLARTREEHLPPRMSEFRKNCAYSNQGQLLFDFERVEASAGDTDASLVLVHGSKRLQYVHLSLLAVENHNGKEKLSTLHKTENLLGLTEAAMDMTEFTASDIIEEAIPKLRSEIEASMADDVYES